MRSRLGRPVEVSRPARGREWVDESSRSCSHRTNRRTTSIRLDRAAMWLKTLMRPMLAGKLDGRVQPSFVESRDVFGPTVCESSLTARLHYDRNAGIAATMSPAACWPPVPPSPTILRVPAAGRHVRHVRRSKNLAFAEAGDFHFACFPASSPDCELPACSQ